MKIKTTFAAALTLSLSACATLPPGMGGGYQSSADRYPIAQAQHVQRVELATVIAVRSVQIAASDAQSATASGIGALIGGLAGHQVGSGNGKTAATIALAVAGGVAGNKVGASAYRQPGLAVTVNTDDGHTYSVTQAADIPLVVGQRVQLIGGDWSAPTARVVPFNS